MNSKYPEISNSFCVSQRHKRLAKSQTVPSVDQLKCIPSLLNACKSLRSVSRLPWRQVRAGASLQVIQLIELSCTLVSELRLLEHLLDLLRNKLAHLAPQLPLVLLG